jgi:hypothetical protein
MLSDLDIEIAKAFCKHCSAHHRTGNSVQALARIYKDNTKDEPLREAVLPYIQSLIESFKRHQDGLALKIKLIKDGKIQLENPRYGIARAVDAARITFSTDLVHHFVDNFVKDVRNRADKL